MLILPLLGRLVAIAICRLGAAQQTQLTVDRILSGEFSEQDPADAGEWRPDGRTVLLKRESKQGGEDIDIVDPSTGKARVVVPAAKLIPSGETSPLSIEDKWLSSDEKRLLIFTNSQRIWRQNTRGDYWALNVATGKLLKLGGDAPPAALMFARLSPDGSRAAYVFKNNLYVESLDSGAIVQLTTDGSETTINGTSDWVYEEELDIRNGWRWSPDGTSIAYWQVDSSAEPIYSLIDDTDTLYPEVRRFAYPIAGQTNPTVRIGVVSASGGPTTWVNDVATSESGYIARMEWVPNSQEILFEHLNRRQNQNRYLIADARTGQVRQVFIDADQAWVDVLDTASEGPKWVDDGRAFLALSEQDGWRHIYAVPANGDAPVLLTPDPFDVDEVAGLDASTGRVYFTASPTNSTQRYLYAVSSRGGGNAVRITPSGCIGTNSYEISTDGRLAFHTVSRFNEPQTSELIRLPSHDPVRKLGDNADLKRRLSTVSLGTTKFITLGAADGSKMDARMTYPPAFDAKRRYPVLFDVYGEPAGAEVEDSWSGGHLLDQLFAERGYIVAAIDNRGTPALKGRSWRKCVYRKIGVIASEDQAAAVKQLDALPYVDAARVAIWGWSGGGTMTLNMLFRYPDLYKLGMAVAPVPDMHLYDTIYQERYMGLPKDNDADYVNGSPITYANRLRGSLLIVHGSGDDNVHYAGTERLVNALVADGKPFQLMAYPNRTHSISEGPGTTRHLYELLVRFLTTNMPP